MTLTTKKSREIAKKPEFKGLVQDFFSWKLSEQLTFRMLIDKGLCLDEKTLYLKDLALFKENYKESGTDCSSTDISTHTSKFQRDGFLIKKDNGFRKPKTYLFTEKGISLAEELLSIQNNDQFATQNSLKKKENIKNSTCKRACASNFKEIKQYKRISFYGVTLYQVQENLKLTTRGMANYLQFDDSALRALLDKKELHGKTKTREAKEFCRLHMFSRCLFPEIDLVYRTWRKIDAENDGIRMPLFKLRQTYVDFKHALLAGVTWYRKKGDSDLPFGDIFSRFYKEKKNCAQRKESQGFLTAPSLQTSNKQKEIALKSLTWKRVRTDARALRTGLA